MLSKKMRKNKCIIIIHGDRNVMMPEEDNNSPCSLTEKILLTAAGILVVVLISILYINMSGDWSLDQDTRTRVLIVAVILFCLNLFLCCYTSRRMGIRFCRPEIQEDDLNFDGCVNSNEPLLARRDLPPSYESVTVSSDTMTCPPLYEEVTFGSLCTEHELIFGDITDDENGKTSETSLGMSDAEQRKQQKAIHVGALDPEQDHHKATG